MMRAKLFFCGALVVLVSCSEAKKTTGWEYDDPGRSCFEKIEDTTVFEKIPYEEDQPDTGFIRIK